jgi:hypothetical protein
MLPRRVFRTDDVAMGHARHAGGHRFKSCSVHYTYQHVLPGMQGRAASKLDAIFRQGERRVAGESE